MKLINILSEIQIAPSTMLKDGELYDMAWWRDDKWERMMYHYVKNETRGRHHKFLRADDSGYAFTDIELKELIRDRRLLKVK